MDLELHTKKLIRTLAVQIKVNSMITEEEYFTANEAREFLSKIENDLDAVREFIEDFKEYEE